MKTTSGQLVIAATSFGSSSKPFADIMKPRKFKEIVNNSHFNKLAYNCSRLNAKSTSLK